MVNLSQYKLFIGDDKKNTISGVTFSFRSHFKLSSKFSFSHDMDYFFDGNSRRCAISKVQVSIDLRLFTKLSYSQFVYSN